MSRRRLLFLGLAATLAASLVIATAGLAWLLRTQSGLDWALARLEQASEGRLQAQGAQGMLAGPLVLERLVFAQPGMRIEAHGVQTRLHLSTLIAGRLVLDPLHVASLDISLGKGDDTPAQAPEVPVGVRLGSVEIGRLRLARGDTVVTLANVRAPYASLGTITGALSAEVAFDLVHERYPLSGKLTAGGTLERLDATLGLRHGDISADLHALVTPFRAQRLVALEARTGPLDMARLREGLPSTAFSVALKATGTAQGGLTGALRASNAQAGPLDQARLPLVSLESSFATEDFTQLLLERTRIVLAGGGALEGGGTLAPRGFDGAFTATRLDLQALRSTLRQTQLGGRLEFALTREEQTVSGTLEQSGMTVSAEAVRRGDTVEIRRLHAAAEGGEATGVAMVRLGEPLGFEADLKLARFNPAAFGRYPEGTISGMLRAKGELGDVQRVSAQWQLAESSLVRLPLETRGSIRVAGRRVLELDAVARLGAARTSAKGSFGTAADRLAVTLDTERLDEHVAQVSGRLTASATLSGTWEVPRAVVSAELSKLELPHELYLSSVSLRASGTLARHEATFTLHSKAARLEGRLQGGLDAARAWKGEILALDGQGKVPFRLRSPTALAVARGRVELGALEASLGEGRLLVRELSWSPERFASSGEFTGLPAQWLIAASGVSGELRASLLLDGRWQVAAAPRLEGTLQLRRASGDVVLLRERPLELGLQSLALDARLTDAGIGARVELASRYASGALGAQLGRDPAAGPLGIGRGSPLLVQGQIGLVQARVLAQPFLGEARFDGRIAADLDIQGTLGAPQLGGVLRGDALSFEMPPYGVYLKNGELRARLQDERLEVERLSVQAGEGRFSAKGSLPLRLADGSATLSWRASEFSALERPDMRLVVSGEGEAGFDGKRFSISGELRADRGHLQVESRMPKLGDDVVIAGQARPVKKQKTTVPVRLNVDLDLGDELTVQMRGLEGKLGGRVNVRTTADGELRAYGRLQTLNATFYAYGQHLQVDPGVLIFDGPIDNPALQITAWRRNQAVEAGVQLSGTARAPRVQLVSQPPVSEGERLAWLVLGRAPSDATKADLGLLQAAAGALLARGEGLPLDRRIARTFGLDEVSFRGSGEVQDRVLAFGKRLSDKLYVSYEQGLGAAASNLVKLDYSLSQRWSLRAETGTTSGWGLFYRFSWD